VTTSERRAVLEVFSSVSTCSSGSTEISGSAAASAAPGRARWSHKKFHRLIPPPRVYFLRDVLRWSLSHPSLYISIVIL
jgi:hypothetical protein